MKNWRSNVCLGVGCFGLSMIIVAKVIWTPMGAGRLFYFWEVLGLTGILLYTPVLVLSEYAS